MDLPLNTRTVLIAAIGMLVFVGLLFFILNEPKSMVRTHPQQNAWVAQANQLTTAQYGFHFNEYDGAILLGDFSCNGKAPKSGEETNGEQFTYCQNSGKPFKISLAWKDANLEKRVFLHRIANTVSEHTNKKGDFNCHADSEFKDPNNMGGVVSDCVIAMADGSLYYASAYFFYPPENKAVSQVLYVYSLNGTADQGMIQNAVRNIANSITFATKPLSFFGVSIAYAQDPGGSGGDAGAPGDGAGDASGACGPGDGAGSCAGDVGAGIGGDMGGPSDGNQGNGDGGATGGGFTIVPDPTNPGKDVYGVPRNPGTGGDPADPSNMPPFVNAGPDRHIALPQSSIQVSGAEARDQDGTITRVLWQQFFGPTANISGGNTLTPTFSGLTVPTSYIFGVLATDDAGATRYDTMVVVVEPEGTVLPPDDGGGGGGGSGSGSSGSGSVGGSSSSGGGGSSLGPKLTADTLITKIGGPVTLSWDTNNGDEGLCTLTGGDIAARYTPIPRIGTTADERETGSVQSLVQGKTTYVLRCGAVTDSVTVGIIPDTKES